MSHVYVASIPAGMLHTGQNGGSASTNVSGKLCAMPGAQRQHPSTMHPSDGRPTPGSPTSQLSCKARSVKPERLSVLIRTGNKMRNEDG